MRRMACALLLCAAAVLGAAQAPAVERTTLLNDLRTLSADDMQGREVGQPGGLKARAYVVSRFKQVGLQPVGASYEYPFSFSSGPGGRTREAANVVGQIRGTRDADRYLVVSAHYDHIGMRDGQVFNGADDNASGTAALFAIARAFMTDRPLHSLLFVAFDAEETGLRGSQQFVRSPPVDRAAIVLNLNMDMIGRDPNNKLFVSGVSTQSYLKTYIARVAARAPVQLVMGYDDPNGPAQDYWVRQSDQYSFIEAKIPGLYFGVEDYAMYHKTTDDFETITRDFYVKAVQTMVMVIREFDAGLAAVDAARPRP